MNGITFTLRGTRPLAIALGFALVSAAAIAEDVSNVTIEAQRSQVVGRNSRTGGPIELVTISRRVSYSDLDLTTHAGATALEKRVGDTATAICRKLDKMYPISAGPEAQSTHACIKKANEDAMAQVRAAIAAAEGGKGAS